jgi:hypothetical protein
VLGGVGLLSLYGRWGLRDLDLVVLRAWCAFAVVAGLVVGFLVVLIDLRIQILVLVFVIEHLAILSLGRNFGTVAKKDDATAAAVVRPEPVVQIHVDVIRRVVNTMVNAGTSELSYTIILELNYSPSTADVAGSSDLPYSGGAQGPSPFATLFAISSYHCSFVLPCRRPMMIIVMLSQPTPPVSLFEARQLSIMFSQIEARSCFATIPRLTNSTTA